MIPHRLRLLLVTTAACVLMPLAVTAADPGLKIGFKTVPAPPRSGSNTVEVTVSDAAGIPINDASVEVRFYMAAMPSMNMPEMKSTFPTSHVSNGLYRGTGRLVMGGNWEVTVTVSRGGTSLARKKFTVVAK